MARNPLFEAIDRYATNERVRMAMYMGSKLESGWRANAVGDNGNSHGFYQINLPFHPSMTAAKARDPKASTQYMLNAYQSGAAKVNPSLWDSDPAMAAAWAAYYAERPAAFYGEQRVRGAWPSVEKAYKGGDPASGASTNGTTGGVQQVGITAIFDNLWENIKDFLNRAYFGIVIIVGALLTLAGFIVLFRETAGGTIAAQTRSALTTAATLGRKV